MDEMKMANDSARAGKRKVETLMEAAFAATEEEFHASYGEKLMEMDMELGDMWHEMRLVDCKCKYPEFAGWEAQEFLSDQDRARVVVY